MLAAPSACRRSATVNPYEASFCASSSTRTTRPGPPMVVTSRVPGTRFSSTSIACATCSRSNAPRASSAVHNVSVTIGDVVDPLRLDQRLADVERLRQPVAVGVDRVVKPDQRFGARNSHLEFRGDDRDARLRHRIDVLEALDLRDHLLRGGGDQRFDVPRRCPRKRHDHVGHGHVDLRLLLARRDGDRERTEQERNERDERRQPRRQKESREAAGNAQRRLCRIRDARHRYDRASPPLLASMPARTGSCATRSPAPNPASTSTNPLPAVSPSRTCRSCARPFASMHVDGRHLAASQHRRLRNRERPRAAGHDPCPRVLAGHEPVGARQLEAHRRRMRARVGHRDDGNASGDEFERERRYLHADRRVEPRLGEHRLRQRCGDPQFARIENGDERPPHRRHVADLDFGRGDNAAVRSDDGREALRRCRHSGVGDRRRRLRLRGERTRTRSGPMPRG